VTTQSFCHRATGSDEETPDTLQTDQQLLDAFALGEKAALCLLLSRYQGLLQHQCRKLTGGNSDDAKDLFSLVLLKVYTERPEQLRKIRHLGGWLSRVAQNKSIDLQRERIAEERRDQRLGHFHEITGNHPRSPEQAMLDRELVAQIQRAFHELPSRLRTTAELRFVEDASYEAISHRLGISQVNARKRVQEARRRLEKAMHDYLGTEGRFQSGSQGFGPCAMEEGMEWDPPSAWATGTEGDWHG
jgi:RNA polymerase sigma-70 factor (ECF subfamily)